MCKTVQGTRVAQGSFSNRNGKGVKFLDTADTRFTALADKRSYSKELPTFEVSDTKKWIDTKRPRGFERLTAVSGCPPERDSAITKQTPDDDDVESAASRRERENERGK